MPAFVLAETPAGYGLFKSSDKKLLKKDASSLEEAASTPEGMNGLLTLKKFAKFDSSASAVAEVASLNEGKVPPMLQELLSEIKNEKKASLAVADPKLATAIKKLPDLDITTVSDSSTAIIYRGIRSCLSELIPGLAAENIKTMSLGLSHSLSRYKLKFSPDKVDTMVVHTISLLDETDKELNIKAMRVKEWYGWHFPELAKILNDNVAYARFIVKVGMRPNTHDADLASFLPEELDTAVKAAAEVSMGTEMMLEDLESITKLADEVIQLTEFRTQLSSYLTSRMAHIAPNLTELIGPLIGAKLISKTGSLVNLAKAPGSTVQILGAEKALFRALKTKHDTPKYGLIYHASLVGQAQGRNKGKIARMLSAKVAITSRTDALSTWGNRGEEDPEEVDEETKTKLGISSRIKVENRLRTLEGRLVIKGTAIGPSGSNKFEVQKPRQYNGAADGVDSSEAVSREVEMADADEVDDQEPATEKKKSKKDKKEKKTKSEAAEESTSSSKGFSDEAYERFAEAAGISVSKFKRKFERGDFEMADDGTPRILSKKELKKKRKHEDVEEEAPKASEEEVSTKKKRKYEDDESKPKKKKKKSKSE
ncbi:hypothetical protein MKZ38_006791 [Zalerion maritima]|uniref:Nucleolar protein 58 n=1 Tax=Zalerion maritima TaxID=339359 RepID=A0AAD5RV69_9PEZI|nr:hypothetical protein MKZ38_006791 [Zalerion maritima]